MDILEAIKKRHSVRGYLSKDVSEDVVKDILETSKFSPSGVNSQPWKVYVVMGEARNKLVKEACEKFDKGEIETEEYQVYPSKESMPDWYKARQRACGFGLYGALVTVHKSVGPNGWGHVGHFIQSICLAAVGKGLGTCLQEAWAGFPKLLKKHLEYGDDEILWCGISLGYEDQDHPANSFRTEREQFDSFAKLLK